MISAQLLGTEKFKQKLAGLSGKIRDRLILAMKVEVINLQAFIKFQKLSGQVLKNRTGTLRRSIFEKVEAQTDQVEGIVGTRISYAPVHEFGGRFQIPAHQVRTHMRTITQAFGNSIPATKVQVREYQVKGHSAHFEMRSFMRSSFYEKRDGLLARLKAAVGEAVQA